MLEITPSLHIYEHEIQFEFIRASGPGGQNVNKVATAVQLRFDVYGSKSLSEDVKARLIKLAGKRMTEDGELVLEAKRFRTQEQNRFDAVEKFRELVKKASQRPKLRKKTKPTTSSVQERLKEKKRRREIKKNRQKIFDEIA